MARTPRILFRNRSSRSRGSIASSPPTDTGVAAPAAPLHVDWCSHAAAVYAVERWHYSHRMPVGKLVRLGVWEHGRFVGVVLFGRGACASIARPFKLSQRRACELVRVALAGHQTPVSRILSIALRMLARQSSGLRVVVSYADTRVGHVGSIYQASNWIYLGPRATSAYRVHGRVVHGRTLGMRYGIGGQSVAWLRRHVDRRARRVKLPAKHKYVYPLSSWLRSRLERQSIAYPKRAGSSASGTPPTQGGGGGAIPTPALRPEKLALTHTELRGRRIAVSRFFARLRQCPENRPRSVFARPDFRNSCARWRTQNRTGASASAVARPDIL